VRLGSSNLLASRWAQLGAGALLLAGLGGWWFGRISPRAAAPQAPLDSLSLGRLRAPLEKRLRQGNASEAEQLQLLKLRLALDDQKGAIALLEPLSDQRPEQWNLRLLLAEMRRSQQDPSGAERELRQILNVHPLQVDALQQLTRLQLEQRRGDQAEQQLRAKLLASKGKAEALPLGLLLADLQQRRQKSAEAEVTYKQLINSHPEDPRPLLALALLHQKQGASDQAINLLREAKLHSTDAAKPMLDQVASSWAMAQLQRPKPAASQRCRGLTAQGLTGTTLPAGAEGCSN
jgi:tetratricopeptide (TPR) repeat protein